MDSKLFITSFLIILLFVFFHADAFQHYFIRNYANRRHYTSENNQFPLQKRNNYDNNYRRGRRFYSRQMQPWGNIRYQRDSSRSNSYSPRRGNNYLPPYYSDPHLLDDCRPPLCIPLENGSPEFNSNTFSLRANNQQYSGLKQNNLFRSSIPSAENQRMQYFQNDVKGESNKQQLDMRQPINSNTGFMSRFELKPLKEPRKATQRKGDVGSRNEINYNYFYPVFATPKKLNSINPTMTYTQPPQKQFTPIPGQVWNEKGKFWGYPERKVSGPSIEKEIEALDDCNPPFCYPARCPITGGSGSCPGPTTQPPACPPGHELQMYNGRMVCVPIDDKRCVPPCLNGGICFNKTCYCGKGYFGEQCIAASSATCQLKYGINCFIGCTRGPYGDMMCICALPNDRNCVYIDIDTRCQSRCRNGGVCKNGVCICGPGFTGPNCEVALNPCSQNDVGKLQCEQVCIPSNNSRDFRCDCYEGFELSVDGRKCRVKTQKKICQNNCYQESDHGKCSIEGICVCKPGWTGEDCGSDVNECSSIEMHGCEYKCINTPGSYLCECQSGWELLPNGRSCATRCPNDCLNRGTCIDKVCRCQDGWSGKDCSADRNECLDPEICDHRCINTPGSYKCDCNKNFILQDDKRTCKAAPCKSPCSNNGTCINGACICTEYYSGETCNIPNLCLLYNPCEHKCINTIGSYLCSCKEGYRLSANSRTCDKKCPDCMRGICFQGRCQCPSGYEGTLCENDVNECNTFYHGCSQICQNIPGSYKCACKEGYEIGSDGRVCVRKTCVPSCKNGGVCIYGICSCSYGYGGESCETVTDICRVKSPCSHFCHTHQDGFMCSCRQGYKLSSDNITCIKECDKCINGNCVNGMCICDDNYSGVHCDIKSEKSSICFTDKNKCEQICVRTKMGYRCECNIGYQLNQDELTCTRILCPQTCGKGICINGVCVCPKGYKGLMCEKQIDCNKSCGLGECINGTCTCPEGYVGEKCEIDKTNQTVNCPKTCNTGACIKGVCVCTPGWEGNMCETRSTCPKFCGNGRCVNGICQCNDGYEGLTCSQKSTCILSCNLGSCQDEKCACPPGLEGSRCEKRSTCPKYCGKGQCVNGICVCNKGYEGMTCQSPVSCSFACGLGICVNGKCRCPPGLEGPMCNKLSTCSFNCGNGDCVNGICVCDIGFEGPSCSIKSKVCTEACYMGTCIDGLCACHDGWKGDNCAIKTCPSFCGQGTCINGSCRCFPGFEGSTCEKLKCREGFKGDLCDRDINECKSSITCQHICKNTFGSFVCECFPGFLLNNDGMSCSPVSCKSCEHGTCINGLCECNNGYFRDEKKDQCLPKINCLRCVNGKCNNLGKCECFSGYEGDDCSQDIDECENNGNVCSQVCINTDGSYLCQCGPGYALGSDNSTCLLGCDRCQFGQCNIKTRQCECYPGFTGNQCQRDMNECQLGIDGCEHRCVNTLGSFKCECRLGYHLASDSRSCQTAPYGCGAGCFNGGFCISGYCRCQPGFSGPTCLRDIDECQLPRDIHGCNFLCQNTYGGYECVCPPGQVLLSDLKTCKVAPEDTMCSPSCKNGGICRGGIKCDCPQGFRGEDCSVNINECEILKPCDKQNGICTDTFGAYYCTCNAGYVLRYDGKNCMTEADAKERPHFKYKGRGSKGILPTDPPNWPPP